MTNQEINIAVAECFGWAYMERQYQDIPGATEYGWKTPDGKFLRASQGRPPSYVSDRNTTPQMLAALKDRVEQITFLSKLIDRKLTFNDLTYDMLWAVLSADQQKVAKAFLVAKGKLEVK